MRIFLVTILYIGIFVLVIYIIRNLVRDKKFTVPDAIAVLAILVGIAIALQTSNASSSPPSEVITPPTQTPSLVSNTPFPYQVRVRIKGTAQQIANARVTLEVPGKAPLRAVTDSSGYAIISIEPSYINKVGRLFVEAEGFNPSTYNIALEPDRLPDAIQLEPAVTSTFVAPTAQVLTTSTAITNNSQENLVICNFDGNVETQCGVDDITDEWGTVESTISNGQYLLETTAITGSVLRIQPMNEMPVVSDFELTLDVKQVSGQRDGESIGFIFRYSNNGYYYFGMRGNGQISASVTDNVNKTLHDFFYWRDTSAMNVQGINTLKVIAKGASIKLFVNNQIVGDINDDRLKTGQVGLLGYVPDGQSATFALDNVQLRLLPQN